MLLQKELITVNIEGQLRAIRIANLNIRPVDYNPVEGILRVYTNLEINIHMDGSDFAKTEEIKETYYSPYFEAIYNQISNYDSSIRSDDMIGNVSLFGGLSINEIEDIDVFLMFDYNKNY